MKFSFLNSIPKLQLTRASAIVWGVVLNILLFLLLVSGDAYIFYRSLVLERPEADMIEPVVLSFSEKDLDEVIRTLDIRSGEFKGLSGAVPVTEIKK
jgi:hypothetical protein